MATGDIQHNLKTGANSELYFSREVTEKASDKYGKLKSKKGIYLFPYLTRMTGDSIKGTVETIESNELRKGRTASKKRIGSESTEGSLDFEMSPTTFDDNLAAAFKNEWKAWTSDKNSEVNLDNAEIPDGKFLTRCTELTKDDWGNWGRNYNTNETLGYRRLIHFEGDSATEDGLITVPKGSVVHELTCGNKDIKYDVLRKLGGEEDEDLYQDYKHMAINTMSLDVQINSIVTGSFTFMGNNNPKRYDENDIRKQYGSDTSSEFEDTSMTGNKFIDKLPKKATDTDQFVSTDGDLWINGKNISCAQNLSLEISNDLQKKYAIFVKPAIATVSQSLNISGSLGTYIVFGETEGLYNAAVDNATNEIMFRLQNKTENPDFIYLFQIFKSTFDSPDSSASGKDTWTDSYSFNSYGEMACRVFRIALPKAASVEFTPATTWTSAGSITIIPTAEINANTISDLSIKIVDELKKADGTSVATQTISDSSAFTVNADGTITAKESAFSTTTDGVIREITVTLTEDGEEFKTSVGYDTTAPAAPTNVSATAKVDKATISWTDSVATDVDHCTVAVYKGTDNTGEQVIFESVNTNVQVYTARKLDKDTSYFVEVKAVDTAGLESTAATATFKTLAS